MRRFDKAQTMERIRKLVICSLIVFAAAVAFMVDNPAMGYPSGGCNPSLQSCPIEEDPGAKYCDSWFKWCVDNVNNICQSGDTDECYIQLDMCQDESTKCYDSLNSGG